MIDLATCKCKAGLNPKTIKGTAMPKKLDSGQKHFLRLIEKGQQCPDGWCPVSEFWYPVVQTTMPPELVEHHKTEDGRGRAKLTESGQNLLDAMAWI